MASVQKIKLSPSRDIPFNKLVLSQSNVRRVKAGVSIEQLAESIAQLQNLELLGLMTIPPYFDEPEQVRPYFRRLRELCDQIGAQLRSPLTVLSMGMSHDFEIAIEEGATEIRVGTALFGERSKKA